MRQGQGSKRSRGRSGGRRNTPQRNQNFDSNGPSIRIRGNANQVYEKYLQLARDATTAGDRVTAENMFQHAEHYFRVLNIEERESQARAQERNNSDGGNTDQQRRPNRDNGPERRPRQPRHDAQPQTENASEGGPAPVARSEQPPRHSEGDQAVDDVSSESSEEGETARQPQRRTRRSNGRPSSSNPETVEAETSEASVPVEVEAVAVEPQAEEAVATTEKQSFDPV